MENLESIAGKHILLADDEEHVRFTLSLVLRRAGCRVTVVEDGTRALQTSLEAARKGTPFDLLVIDIQMPGLTGVEVAKELSHLETGTPVLLITGYRDREIVKTLKSENRVVYAEKPFSPERLLDHVAVALKRGHGNKHAKPSRASQRGST
jgi:DNA-binding NtrC family response regulator